MLGSTLAIASSVAFRPSSVPPAPATSVSAMNAPASAKDQLFGWAACTTAIENAVNPASKTTYIIAPPSTNQLIFRPQHGLDLCATLGAMAKSEYERYI